MDIAKQIIDQRVYKILADNPELQFNHFLQELRAAYI